MRNNRVKPVLFLLVLLAAVVLFSAACGSSTTATTSQEPTFQVETIEEKVLYDQNNVKITATDLIHTADDTEIKILIENNTNRSVTVQTRDSSVNGYMIDSLISCNVSAGKKAVDTISFYKNELEEAGITTIADFDFRFHIFDTDGLNTGYDTPRVHIKTSAYEGFEYLFNDEGEEVYNDHGVRIVAQGTSLRDYSGPGLRFYMENNREGDICVQVKELSVDGFMIDSIFSEDIVAGKRSICHVILDTWDLQDKFIESIDEAELSFHIFSWKDSGTIADTPTFKLVYES